MEFRRYVLSCGAALTLLAGCTSSGSTVPFAPSSSANLTRRSDNVEPDKPGKIKLFIDDYEDPVPYGITAGTDGALWFADPGNDTIGRMTTNGRFTFYRAGAEVSIGITVGSDGALWFTTAQDQPDAFIGRVSTSGVVHLFNDPDGSYPQGIASGPDGALWFGESNGTIGRMTTQGSVSHFKVGPKSATILSIVAGPDGALWATQTGNYAPPKLIRLSISGRVKTYKVSHGPQYICVGPDGALWFTEFGNLIGRITTAGALSEFRIKGVSSGATPVGIATGLDGALWFTEDATGASAIGRMTTAGKLRLYDVPGGSFASLEQITLGPHGDMWFVSASSPSAIGRITTH